MNKSLPESKGILDYHKMYGADGPLTILQWRTYLIMVGSLRKGLSHLLSRPFLNSFLFG